MGGGSSAGSVRLVIIQNLGDVDLGLVNIWDCIFDITRPRIIGSQA